MKRMVQKRVLFVDDEEILRELYASLDSVLGAEHEVRTAASGAEALQLLAQDRFDIIVSDLAMPQMDGVEFLSKVVEAHPESARIIISGFADQLKIAECLSVGHRFFRKPFSFKSLTQLLRRICEYSYLVKSERVRRIICGSKALPTPPDTFLRLNEALNSDYTDIEDIGRIVERDAGLSTKLLHIVNSAQFGFSREIVTPVEAVQMLGVEVLRALLIGCQVFSFYDENPFVRLIFSELWNHSLRTATIARKLALAEGLKASEAEECFLTALLHDIGKLILAANAQTEYQLAVDLTRSEGIPLHEAERALFSSTHAQVGAYLLALWGIPDSVVRAVELHHTLSEAGIECFNPVLALHIAQCLDLAAAREGELDTALLERLGLAHRIPEWKKVLQMTN